jgi:pyruvate dehydrogenase E2 component (dihydrolipoamide acetyltransferase)
MAQAVLMPKVGISVESCIITAWKKQPGDVVAEGDILFDYETDKSSLECESTAAGVLLEQFFGEGDEVPVLTAVCAVGQAGADVSGLRPGTGGPQPASADAAPPQPGPATAEAAAPPAPQAQPTAPASGGVKISPRAKNLAEKHNLNPAFATPTGPYGRVIERDVRTAAEQGVGLATGAATATGAPGTGIGGRAASGDVTAAPGAAAPEYTVVTLTGIRKVISKSMTASLATIPQLTHNFSFDASAIMAYRATVKTSGEAQGLPNITLNDMVLYAVSRVLPKYPSLNCHMLDGTTQRQFRDVQLGMAVDTERGLMVPVIKNANRLTLAQISAEAKRLAAAAQGGGINPDDLSGGTFTVSNLGALGVESFTPVINPPEAGILGVDCVVQRPREAAAGGIELYPAMGISLTYDHRAIDGAPASRFAQELCRTLESFALLLAN